MRWEHFLFDGGEGVEIFFLAKVVEPECNCLYLRLYTNI